VLFLEPSAYGVEDDGPGPGHGRNFPTALAVFLSRPKAAGASPGRTIPQPPSFDLQGLPEPISHQSPAQGISLPVPELARSAAVLGNVQLLPDSDGSLPADAAPGGILTATSCRPSLGLWSQTSPAFVWSHCQRDHLVHGARRIPLDRESEHPALSRPSGTHRAYSAAAVCSPKFGFARV
jgi:hypothetical protein